MKEAARIAEYRRRAAAANAEAEREPLAGYRLTLLDIAAAWDVLADALVDGEDLSDMVVDDPRRTLH